jgi:hypothetical protein
MALFAPAPPSSPIDHDQLMSDGPKDIYREWDRALDVSRAPTGRWTELETALYNACMDAAHANWDGYGANPISPGAAEHARDLLALLPTAFPAPTVGVDADGEVSVEWHGAPGSMFGISVSPSGELIYAGVYGASRVRGRELLGPRFPTALLSQLQRLFDNGGDWRAA